MVSPIGLSPSWEVSAAVVSRKSRRCWPTCSTWLAWRLSPERESLRSSGNPASSMRPLISSKMAAWLLARSRSMALRASRIVSGSSQILLGRPRVGFSAMANPPPWAS
ncbi:hypothetical protein D3C73_1392850 [compost metagenome]